MIQVWKKFSGFGINAPALICAKNETEEIKKFVGAVCDDKLTMKDEFSDVATAINFIAQSSNSKFGQEITLSPSARDSYKATEKTQTDEKPVFQVLLSQNLEKNTSVYVIVHDQRIVGKVNYDTRTSAKSIEYNSRNISSAERDMLLNVVRFLID